VSHTFVVRASEAETFGRCRRAWDYSARDRSNLVPVSPPGPDLRRAILEALAVYYLPAMDDWNRTIVRPLAVQALHRALERDRRARGNPDENDGGDEDHEEAGFAEAAALGERLLEHYFAWSADLDEFDSLLSDDEFWSPVPDPAEPTKGLVTADGRPIRYLGRIDQLVADLDDENWVVQHRLVEGDFPDSSVLLVDQDAAAHIWALEYSYPHVRISGTIYNELRIDAGADVETRRVAPDFEGRDRRDMTTGRHTAPRRNFTTPFGPHAFGPQAFGPEPEGADPLPPGDPDGPAGPPPTYRDVTEVVAQDGDAVFRRTRVRRSRASIARAADRIATLTLEIGRAGLAAYPNPAAENCPLCAYRAPCVAETEGRDPSPVLAAGYRPRRPDETDFGERLLWQQTDKRRRAAYGGTAFR
jgi:hypothetical protein